MSLSKFVNNIRKRFKMWRFFRRNNCTILMKAIIYNDVKWLKENIANYDVNEKNKFGFTAFLWAAITGKVELMELLLENGADLHTRNNLGLTPLIQSVCSGEIESVRFLLDKSVNVNDTHDSGGTALHQAIFLGHTEIAKELLNRGADTECAYEKYGSRPLHLATWHYHPEIITELLKKGADINATENDSMTAFMYCARDNNLHIAKILLQHGACTSSTNKNGRTALDIARKNGHKDIITLLEAWDRGERKIEITEIKEQNTQGNVEYIRNALDSEVIKQRSIKKTILHFGISLLAFVVLGVILQDFIFILLVIPVLLIHEFGHFIAMKAFGYKGLQIRFIPLVGAAAYAERSSNNLKHEAIVLLAGPLPGIVIGLILLTVHHFTNGHILFRVGFIFLFINWINLIPLAPLDGGNLVRLIFFNSSAKLEIGAKFVMISLLIAIAVLMKEWFILAFLVYILYNLKDQNRYTIVSHALRKACATINIDGNMPIEYKLDSAIISALNRPRDRQLAMRWIAEIWPKISSKKLTTTAITLILAIYLLFFLPIGIVGGFILLK